MPGTPRDPWVRPPAEAAARFAEVMADYERRKTSRCSRTCLLSRNLTGCDGDEVDVIREGHSAADVRTRDGIAQGKQPSLSDVYFDRTARSALTAISTWCGGLCADVSMGRSWRKRRKGGRQTRPWVGMLSRWRKRAARGRSYWGSPVTRRHAWRAPVSLAVLRQAGNRDRK